VTGDAGGLLAPAGKALPGARGPADRDLSGTVGRRRDLADCLRAVHAFSGAGRGRILPVGRHASRRESQSCTVSGALHGLETFLQLIQPGPEGFEAPAVHIADRPRFAWRGLMLDLFAPFLAG